MKSFIAIFYRVDTASGSEASRWDYRAVIDGVGTEVQPGQDDLPQVCFSYQEFLLDSLTITQIVGSGWNIASIMLQSILVMTFTIIAYIYILYVLVIWYQLLTITILYICYSCLMYSF